MKKCMQQGLSVLMALCLLCAVLPLGGMMSVSAETKTEMTAADNRISNGDFECFKSGEAVFWHGGAFDEGETYGRYARVYDITSTETRSMYQTIAVDSGVTYKLTFKAKVVSGSSFTVNVEDSNSVRSLQRACTGTNVWDTYVYLFKYDGSLQEATLRFTVEDANADVYIDDVTLDCETDNITETTGVSYDGYIIDGDFESGSENYWTVTGGEIVTFNGDYALKSTTTSRYSNVAEQVILVEENTDYVLDVKSYYDGSLSGGIARVHIYAGTTGSTELASPSYYWNITAGSWNSHQLTFNSGANTAVRIVLQQHAAPSSSTAMNGNIYYDDFVVKKASDIVETTVVNMLTNGDFEAGNVTGWSSGSGSEKVSASTSAAYNGSNYGAFVPSRGITFTAYQDVVVEANTDYTITFWYKSILTSGSAIRPMYFGVYANNATNTNATKISTQTELPYAQTEWTQVTTTFNSGSYTTVRLGFGCKSSSGQDNYLYVDDIVMADPNADSGDSGETPVDPEDPVVPDTNNALYFYSNKAYTTLQEIDLTNLVSTQTGEQIRAKAGKTYKVTFSARAITNGFRLVINDETNNDLFWSEDIRSWQTIEFYHRISASEMKIELRTLGNGTVNGVYNGDVETNVYIDLANIQVVEIPDTEVNLLEHGGKSAMEMDEAGAVGGLGFLFSANIKDFQYANDNSQTEHLYTVYKYAEQSGKANPYINDRFPNDPYDYTVVRMGAIVSNKLGEVVDTDLTIENAVSGTGTIDIVGSKAMKELCDDTHYVYGVRVTNIPESAFGRTIYARPYITILIGDEEVTLYGDTVSASYEQIMGGVA